MSRTILRLAAAATLAGALTLTTAVAPASADATAAHSASTAADAAQAKRPYAKVTWPKSVFRTQPITYNWRITRTDQLGRGDEVVMFTKVNRKSVGRIQISRKAPEGHCGVVRDGADYEIFCIVHKPLRWKRFYMTFKVWPSGKYSSVISDHYWGAVAGGSSPRSYIQQLDRSHRIGRSTSKVRF